MPTVQVCVTVCTSAVHVHYQVTGKLPCFRHDERVPFAVSMQAIYIQAGHYLHCTDGWVGIRL